VRQTETQHGEIGSSAECGKFGMQVTAIESPLLDRRKLPHHGNQRHACRRQKRHRGQQFDGGLDC
jgi:hypothetical protein